MKPGQRRRRSTAAAASYLMVMIWPKFISMLLTWAMKMAARASYRAVPSMLMVAPTGSTKRVIRLSILLFSSKHLKVTGRVAELPVTTETSRSSDRLRTGQQAAFPRQPVLYVLLLPGSMEARVPASKKHVISLY